MDSDASTKVGRTLYWCTEQFWPHPLFPPPQMTDMGSRGSWTQVHLVQARRSNHWTTGCSFYICQGYHHKMRHIFWPTVYINSLRPSWGTRAQHASPGTCWWSWTGLHNTSCYDFCTQRRYQSTTRRTWVTRTRTHHRCTLCTHTPTYSHFSSSVKLLSSLLLMPIVHYIYRKCSTNRNTNTMIYWSETKTLHKSATTLHHQNTDSIYLAIEGIILPTKHYKIFYSSNTTNVKRPEQCIACQNRASLIDAVTRMATRYRNIEEVYTQYPQQQWIW